MRDISFDDYLLEGVVKIIDVAREISGADKVNLAAYCIGGTLVATYLGPGQPQGDPDHVPGRVGHAVHDANRFCASG